MSISWDDHEELRRLKDKLSLKFELLGYLEGGGFGKVFKLRDRKLDRLCALKVLNHSRLMEYSKKAQENVKKRFLREAGAYARFRHSNIVAIYECGGDDDWPYFIMEYIEGKDLNHILKEKGKLEFNEVLKISKGVLNGLGGLHKKGLIHRDIKPKNIMVEKTDGRIVIIDLGIVKDSAASGLTKDQSFGTPFYMAPEQIEDSGGKIGPGTDIYAFGVVLFEMLAGNVPFRGSDWDVMKGHMEKGVPNVREINPDPPRGIEEVIFKAMRKTPTGRFKSAEEFWVALSEVGVTRKLKWWKEKKKIKGNLLAIISVVVTIIGIVVGILTLYNPFKFNEISETHYENNNEATVSKNRAKDAKDKDDTEPPKEIIAVKPREVMTKDFNELKIFLKGGVTSEEKLERCRVFLNKHQNVSENNDTQSMSMVSEILKEKDQLEIAIKKEKEDNEYQGYFNSAVKYLEAEEFKKARESANKAKDIKDTTVVKDLLKSIDNKQKEKEIVKADYDAIIQNITLQKYLGIKDKYPNSTYLPDLRERLKAADKTLPPEDYWDKGISKNRKGYYEHTFGPENNSHLMIYITEKKIWIDKYEISWAQFKKFLKDENLPIPDKENNEYIRTGDEFPAVVTFDDAERYCQRYGFRLPTESEWEYAAGKGSLTFPWGNESPDEGGVWRANFDTLRGGFEGDGFKGTAPIASFWKFSSPFGAVNMAGNVWEWVQGKILKGGGYLSLESDLKIENSRKPESFDKEGFRCVKVEN